MMMFHVNHEGCKWNHVKLGECRVSVSILQWCLRRHQQRGWFPPHLCSGLWTLGTPRNWQFAKLVENIISEHDQTVFFFVFFVFWGSKWVSKFMEKRTYQYQLLFIQRIWQILWELWTDMILNKPSREFLLEAREIHNWRPQNLPSLCTQGLPTFAPFLLNVSWCLQKVAQFWNNLLKASSSPLKIGCSQRRKGLPCMSSLTHATFRGVKLHVLHG